MKLREINMTNKVIVTLDVNSLYANVPGRKGLYKNKTKK